MKRLPSALLLALCLLVPAAYADEKEEVAKAQRAATAWLTLPADSWRVSGYYIK